MIIHKNIDQCTDEWFSLRKGKITASVVSCLFVKGKDTNRYFGVGAYTLMYKLIEERITGVPRENFTNKGTEWGHDNEILAREHYERIRFQKVEQVAFIEVNEWIGCSPDFLVGENGGGEIKCLPTQHIYIILDGSCKDTTSHIKQCQYSLWCSGRQWWDLCYYHPNFPDVSKMKIIRLEPDLKMHKEFEIKTNQFIKEAKELESKILNMKS